MSENARPSRISLWLVGALCAAPVLGSYIAYYFASPEGHTNYGDLMETRALPAGNLRLVDGTGFQLIQLKGKWILLMVDSGSCDEFCQRKLIIVRQLRLAQGKDKERIERAWLVTDDVAPTAAVANGIRGTWMIRAAGSALLRQLPAPSTPTDHIYVIDPLGNLVLRYPREADPLKIIKDLTRLLKTSRIG